MELLKIMNKNGVAYTNCIIVYREIESSIGMFSDYALYVGNRICAAYSELKPDSPDSLEYPSTEQLSVYGEYNNSSTFRRIVKFFQVFSGILFESKEELDLAIMNGLVSFVMEEVKDTETYLSISPSEEYLPFDDDAVDSFMKSFL